MPPEDDRSLINSSENGAHYKACPARSPEHGTMPEGTGQAFAYLPLWPCEHEPPHYLSVTAGTPFGSRASCRPGCYLQAWEYLVSYA